MGYEIKYTQATRRERMNAALEDALKWLGGWESRETHRLLIILGATKMAEMRARQKVRSARFALRFSGIRGVPATAFIKYAWSLVQ